MNLYDLLVNGISHNIVFNELVLLDYEIYKYNHNLINFNLDIFKNINSKFSHPTLMCSFKFTYLFNNIEQTIYFQTYNTFTSSDKNSININKKQYFNIYDFVIDQNNNFIKRTNLNSYDTININRICNKFNYTFAQNYVKIPLQEMLMNKRQCKFTQIIYFDRFGIRINPLK